MGEGRRRNHRAGTENLVSIVGMAQALKLCVENIEAKTSHLKALKSYMNGKTGK